MGKRGTCESEQRSREHTHDNAAYAGWFKGRRQNKVAHVCSQVIAVVVKAADQPRSGLAQDRVQKAVGSSPSSPNRKYRAK